MTGSDYLLTVRPEYLTGWTGPARLDEVVGVWWFSVALAIADGRGSFVNPGTIQLDVRRPEVQALLLREVVVAMGLRSHLGCGLEITLDRSRLGDSVRCVTVYGDGEGTVWPAPEVCPYGFVDATFAPGLLDLDVSLPEEELAPLVVRALWEALCQPTDASAHQEGER